MNPIQPPLRRASIDAYRGFVMLLMMAEVLRLSRVAKAIPESDFWQFLGRQQTHVEWRGCTLHDLIQPSFSFLVGTALAFSLVNRKRLKQSKAKLLLHAAWRSMLLILLGVFLRSRGQPQTNWTFEDTLTQIGLGYLPLVLIGLANPLWHRVAFIVLLLSYWIVFAAYPVPDGNFFRTHDVGVAVDWPHHPQGFAAHWDKNSTPAWAFDTWFLNLFPRAKPFEFNEGGYATLSFITTLATMILGLIAGSWMVSGDCWRVLRQLICVGLLLLVLGYGFDQSGLCLSVKRIWTPAWTLFSGGWCCLMLGFFVLTCDLSGHSGWAYPLKVIGANSLVAYMLAHYMRESIIATFRTHFGGDVFQLFGKEYEPLLAGLAIMFVYWIMLWWLYIKRVFIRI